MGLSDSKECETPGSAPSFGKRDTNGKFYKFENQRGLGAALEPRVIALSVTKVSILHSLSAVVAEDPNALKFSKPIVASLGMMAAKDLTIVTARSLIQNQCAQKLDPRMCAKLMKDVPRSVARKRARDLGRLSISKKMFFTSARAAIIPHAAIFVVETSIGLFHVLSTIPEYSPKERTAALKKFTWDTVKRLSVAVGSVFVVGVCTSAGTLIFPGVGTVVGNLIGDTLLYLV